MKKFANLAAMDASTLLNELEQATRAERSMRPGNSLRDHLAEVVFKRFTVQEVSAPVRVDSFTRMLKSALMSTESAHRLAAGESAAHCDVMTLRHAATQAAQAARELSELAGYVTAREEASRK